MNPLENHGMTVKALQEQFEEAEIYKSALSRLHDAARDLLEKDTTARAWKELKEAKEQAAEVLAR